MRLMENICVRVKERGIDRLLWLPWTVKGLVDIIASTTDLRRFTRTGYHNDKIRKEKNVSHTHTYFIQ